jgi:flagellar motor protein MotB
MKVDPASAQQDAKPPASRRETDAYESRLADLQRRYEAAMQAERERSREVVLLTNLLAREEERHEELADRLTWSAAVHEMLLEQPKSWSLLSAVERRRRQLLRLRSAGLFDHEAYLKRYPDVRDSGMDPLSHYLLHGLREGRLRSSETTGDRD